MAHPPPNKPPLEIVKLREARGTDITAMQRFIFEHGANEWNFLPEQEVKEQLAAIATGETLGIVATQEEELVGFVTYIIGDCYPEYEEEADRSKPRGYLAEAVVRKDCAGRGIGSSLIERAKLHLRALGIQTIYAHRHSDNAPSGGMLRKAGFKEVGEYYDPEHRDSGSRRTAVARFKFEG